MSSKKNQDVDERFRRVQKDPRFWEMPEKERKIKIDKRFQSMFHEQRFKVKYTVDKRGRPINHTSTDDLKRFYKVSDSEDEDEEDEEGGTSKKEAERKKKKKVKEKPAERGVSVREEGESAIYFSHGETFNHQTHGNWKLYDGVEGPLNKICIRFKPRIITLLLTFGQTHNWPF